MITTIFDEKNEKITISFKYQNYANVFNKIDSNKLLKHRFHDYAIESKFIVELKILKRYLNNNLKQKFIVFFRRQQKHSSCSSKKTTICDYT